MIEGYIFGSYSFHPKSEDAMQRIHKRGGTYPLVLFSSATPGAAQLLPEKCRAKKKSFA